MRRSDVIASLEPNGGGGGGGGGGGVITGMSADGDHPICIELTCVKLVPQRYFNNDIHRPSSLNTNLQTMTK
jgi:hypothetical protein